MNSPCIKFLATVLLGLPSTLLFSPSQAATFVCTPGFGSSVTPGGTISAALIGPPPPCPASTVTASLNTGSPTYNAGIVFASDAIYGLGTSDFNRTSSTSVGIGANGSTNEPISLAFTQPVEDPFLFFSYTDSNTSFIFTQPFILLQSNNANVTGLTVTTTGANTQNDGFVIQLQGTYSTIGFTYANPSSGFNSVAFTTGVQAVPGPLPLMGVAMGFGFTRKLRRRIHS
jgi:hypothetical protein